MARQAIGYQREFSKELFASCIKQGTIEEIEQFLNRHSRSIDVSVEMEDKLLPIHLITRRAQEELLQTGELEALLLLDMFMDFVINKDPENSLNQGVGYGLLGAKAYPADYLVPEEEKNNLMRITQPTQLELALRSRTSLQELRKKPVENAAAILEIEKFTGTQREFTERYDLQSLTLQNLNIISSVDSAQAKYFAILMRPILRGEYRDEEKKEVEELDPRPIPARPAAKKAALGNQQQLR